MARRKGRFAIVRQTPYLPRLRTPSGFVGTETTVEWSRPDRAIPQDDLKAACAKLEPLPLRASVRERVRVRMIANIGIEPLPEQKHTHAIQAGASLTLELV